MSRTLRFLLSIIGQSNEIGTGPGGSANRVRGTGAPYMDASLRSMWPATSEAMARRGHWLAIRNTAQGGTSLCDAWAGRCRTWASGMIVIRGSYILSGGGLWRCNGATSTAFTSTVAPTGTVDTTGADSIPWVYVSAAGAGDTDGVVYTYGSTRFDPLGYVQAAIDAVYVNGAIRPGFDAAGILVSIGQTDYTVGSTRAQYAAAMQAVAERVTSLGIVCWLGMTCYMAGGSPTTRESVMQSVLLPGRTDAIAALASNSLVRQGANLRTALGVLTAGAADTTVGLQSDDLHMTSTAYDAAGVAQADAFAAGGW